jgi:hypothetical protein
MSLLELDAPAQAPKAEHLSKAVDLASENVRNLEEGGIQALNRWAGFAP